MGTRADFYVGRGKDAEWLGSIAWDGYPDGIDPAILEATQSERYREAVASFLKREDGTTPELGWPWPWDDSQTTDFAYALDGEKVHASSFGSEWCDPLDQELDWESLEDKAAEFPDMSKRSKPAQAGSRRSGVMVISVPEPKS